MIFRNDYGPHDGADLRARVEAGRPQFDGTNLGIAISDDGIAFRVGPQPVWAWRGELDGRADAVKRVYDPRLAEVDGTLYICFALDGRYGVRGGIATTEDFEHFDVLNVAPPDHRNMVLFPERINGRLARFERPMPIYGHGAR